MDLNNEPYDCCPHNTSYAEDVVALRQSRALAGLSVFPKFKPVVYDHTFGYGTDDGGQIL